MTRNGLSKILLVLSLMLIVGGVVAAMLDMTFAGVIGLVVVALVYVYEEQK